MWCLSLSLPCLQRSLPAVFSQTGGLLPVPGEHPGQVPAGVGALAGFGCPPWLGRSGAPGTHVPLSAAPIPQLLSLHLTQLNIKASKHFSSSAQHCLPNYPPAGLSDSASCFPGCWQPLASTPASLRGKPCSPNLPAQPLHAAPHALGLPQVSQGSVGLPESFQRDRRSCLFF